MESRQSEVEISGEHPKVKFSVELAEGGSARAGYHIIYSHHPFTKTLRSLIKGQLTSAQRRASAIQGHIQTVQNKDIEKEGTQKSIYWHTDIDNIFFTRAPCSGNTES